MLSALDPAVARVLGAIGAALAGGTLVRWLWLRRAVAPDRHDRWLSLGTWWTLYGLLLLCVLGGRPAVLAVFAVAGAVGLRELLRLGQASRLYPWAAASVPLLYLWAWWDWRGLYTLWLPPMLLALALVGGLWRDPLAGAAGALGSLARGWLLAVGGPAYAGAVASLPPPPRVAPDGLGGELRWLLLLLVLTELNDMAQAWWGRRLGRRRLAPVLSPHKTWEGFVGGMATTAAAAALVAPLLTPIGTAPPAGSELVPPRPAAALLGALLAVSGLLGDLAVSALKRRAGVKDSGRLLPGQGGLMDRFDSLATTAPVFFFTALPLWT